MKVVPYFNVGPRLRYTKPGPRAGCIATSAILGALLLLLASALVGQVTAVAELRDGVAELIVGNPSTKPVAVEVSIFRDTTRAGGPVLLGDTVSALISPRAFVLPPNTLQVVRIRVRAPVKPGELLRIATLLTPTQPVELPPPGAEVTVALRLITKLVDVREGP